jgi:hypothetical protein
MPALTAGLLVAMLSAMPAAADHCPPGQFYRVRLNQCVGLNTRLASAYVHAAALRLPTPGSGDKTALPPSPRRNLSASPRLSSRSSCRRSMTGRHQNSEGGRTAALEEMAGTRNCGIAASGERVEPTLCALQNLPCERVESARKRFLAEQNASVRAKARVPIRPRTFGGGPLGNAECPSITPAPRSLPLASLDERHPLRGSKASSRAPATKRDRISNGVATKSATVSGRRSRACRQSRHSRRSSHARPTARHGDAPCRSPRCRSRNCNRRRNLHNPAGGAATLGVWRWAAGAARRPGLVITTSRPTRGWEQDRRGDEVQYAALTPWPKKRSNFASPRRHSP